MSATLTGAEACRRLDEVADQLDAIKARIDRAPLPGPAEFEALEAQVAEVRAEVEALQAKIESGEVAS
jgi:ubiquinone biosynthesis protein UbiJ